MAQWAIGIDIGGTFTDLVAVDHDTGLQHSLKTLTTYADPTTAVAQGIAQLMARYGIQAAQVQRVVHATTLFTNALIERRGARAGMLVTEGFRDILLMGNERKFDLYDMTLERCAPLAPRDLLVEVPGRLDARGNELTPLNLPHALHIVDDLVARGVESLGICLLHAYQSDRHERQLAAAIAGAHPSLSLTLSSDTAPVIREYERMTTTLANAYIQPLAAGYLDTLAQRLNALGLPSDVLMMLSNGGLSHLQGARELPIALLESGPAAGAISAAHHSAREAQHNLLAFDMGGTTAKLCVVEDGRPSITFGFEAARQKRFAEGSGMPISITTVDLIEIGAGGGSIAHCDVLGLLKVGPHSAGSEPGPACFQRGGVDPTVTDANLLLGYLNGEFFAGGSLPLNTQAARNSFSPLAQTLNRPVEDIAWGVHDIVAENMAAAARVHVAERGKDPRHFVMVATGGGGPLHGYHVARKIGISTIICPPEAGVASAYGLLVAPARADRSRTLLFRPAQDDLQVLEAEFTSLEQDVRDTLDTLTQHFSPVTLTRHADGRFAGQGFNLTVALPDGPYAGQDTNGTDPRQALDTAFRQAYTRKFGRTPPNVPIELVNLRVSGEAPPRQAFEAAALPASSADAPVPSGHRQVFFPEHNGYVETPVYRREQLRPGFLAQGPLLVEEPSTTLVVGPHGQVTMTDNANLIVHIKDSQA